MVLLIISLFISQIIGLEMMNVVQMAFFCLATLDEVQPFLATLAELYLVVNGYNRLFDWVQDTL